MQGLSGCSLVLAYRVEQLRYFLIYHPVVHKLDEAMLGEAVQQLGSQLSASHLVTTCEKRKIKG